MKALVALLRCLIGLINITRKKYHKNFVKEIEILHRESWEMSSQGD